jgi:hypothetical protein
MRRPPIHRTAPKGAPKTLPIIAVSLIVLGLVLRVIIPDNSFLSGGWPLGTQYYRSDEVALRFCLFAGVLVGAVAVLRRR